MWIKPYSLKDGWHDTMHEPSDESEPLLEVYVMIVVKVCFSPLCIFVIGHIVLDDAHHVFRLRKSVSIKSHNPPTSSHTQYQSLQPLKSCSLTIDASKLHASLYFFTAFRVFLFIICLYLSILD